MLSVLGVIVVSTSAFAWFSEGHQIVAIIAADDLTPTATSRVAQILDVPADTGSVEKAMAAASIRPDTEFREEDRSTAPWHFIDIRLQDKQADNRHGAHKGIVSQQKSMRMRGGCVTALRQVGSSR
jgi:hypothetical protein